MHIHDTPSKTDDLAEDTNIRRNLTTCQPFAERTFVQSVVEHRTILGVPVDDYWAMQDNVGSAISSLDDSVYSTTKRKYLDELGRAVASTFDAMGRMPRNNSKLRKVAKLLDAAADHLTSTKREYALMTWKQIQRDAELTELVLEAQDFLTDAYRTLKDLGVIDQGKEVSK